MGSHHDDERLAAVGKRIREMRQARGMTQQDLGDRAGVGRTSVANIEAGRQGSFGLILLCDIATALRVSPGVLLDPSADVAAMVADLRRQLAAHVRAAADAWASGLDDGAPTEAGARRVPTPGMGHGSAPTSMVAGAASGLETD